MIDPAALDDAQARFDFLRAVPGLALVAATNGGEYHGPCPVCGGRDRFVCWPHPREGRPRAFCRQCHPDPMAALDFLRWRDGLTFLDACARLDVRGVRALPRPAKPPKARAHTTPTLVDTTDFEDARGVVVLRKERYEPGWPDRDGAPRDKSFKLYHPDGAGWAPGKGTAEPRAMFRLAACLAAPPGSTLYFTEGELKAKALLAGGRLATCRWEGGTAWRAGYRAPFVDQHAVILEDADQTGADLTAKLLPDLLAVARSVRVVRFPDLGDGADLIDWLAAGHTLDELDALVAATVPIAAAPDPPEPPAAPYRLLTAADLAALPPPSWLIEGLFETGKLAGLYGWYGGGKSFLALDWALCIAAGLPWFGRPTQAGPVVYIAPEGVGGLHKRLVAWSAARGVPIPETFRVLPDTVNMLDPGTPAALTATLTAYGLADAALIVIDTLARSMPGGEENNQYFSLVVEHAGQVQKATGAAVLVVHHSGKNETAGFRGGTSFPAGADTVIGFRNDDGVITLKCEKQKDHEPFADSRWVLVPTGESCVLGPATDQPDDGEALSGRMRLVLEALISPVLADGASARDLQDATGLAPGALFWCLNRLISRDLVGKSGRKGSVGVRYKAKAGGYAALGQVAPWLAILAPTHTDSYESQAPITPIPTPLTPTDSHAGLAEVGTDSHDSHATHTDSHRLTLPSDPTHTHPTPPIRVGVCESEESGDIPADPLPDPSVIAPVWGTPPDTAPPRPATACWRGHKAVRWDDATGRWRCYTCWERYQE